ncbi:PadR family transcriptional regulator [Dyella sp. C9]|uniref:PadR family transcriptional regulator n=1 Tax=Dyella sp. C9 TaxID=2202154 RepID=UPI000DEEEE8A|nr:PadR family transcriptional regulator [Dyella sp. C9]
MTPSSDSTHNTPRGGSRLLGHGDLRLLLLALIEQQPRHGYELIRLIGEMFHGHYTPSPGAIYPTLTLLEELGQIQVEQAHGNRKRYAMTEAGHAFLADNQDAVEAMTLRTRHAARTAAKMALPPVVRQAMHELKHALMTRGKAWNTAEARRVAALLDDVAQSIATPPEH